MVRKLILDWASEGNLRRMYCKEGMKLGEIAKRFEVSQTTVSRRLAVYDIRLRPRRTTVPITTEEFWKDHVSGMNVNQIAKKHGVTHDCVMRRLSVSGRKIMIQPHEETAAIHFVPVKSKAMAYVLGVCKGDGSVFETGRTLQRGGRECVIAMKATDIEFVSAFHGALIEIGLRPRKIRSVPYPAPAKNQWKAMAYSSRFYDWYHGLSDEQYGSFVSHSDAARAAWLRGIYDSEGSFPVVRGCYRINFCMANVVIMNLAEEFLKSKGIKYSRRIMSPGTGGTKMIHRIEISSRAESTRFLRWIRPSIPRKDVRPNS